MLNQLIPNLSELIPFNYADIKNPQYENLLNSLIQTAPSYSSPTLHHMFGIPGAGKSTFYAQQTWQPHILVAFDDIMERLPQYQEDVKKLGPVQAFQNWELPARVIGYELLNRAIHSRKNIFFDHGGANNSHIHLLKNIHTKGYQTEMYYITCSLEIALQRIKKREAVTHRHTPETMVRQRLEFVNQLAEQYKRIVDTFYVYDNSNNTFVLRDKINNPRQTADKAA